MKDAGLDEIADLAGDVQTIFSGDAGFFDRMGAVADLVVGTDFNNRASKATRKTSKKFDAKSSDTASDTSKEAFRNAKDQNGVPRSQQPDKTTTVRDKNTGENLKQYEFTNSKGEKVTIRKDNPTQFKDGTHQGPHYNAGSGDKLKQHHFSNEQ